METTSRHTGDRSLSLWKVSMQGSSGQPWGRWAWSLGRAEVSFLFFFFFFGFLGPHPRHMEVSRLGVKSELPTPQPQQHGI